jgi:hypothetical protein
MSNLVRLVTGRSAHGHVEARAIDSGGLSLPAHAWAASASGIKSFSPQLALS